MFFIKFDSFSQINEAIPKGISPLIDQLEKELEWQEHYLDSIYNPKIISENNYLVLKSELDLKKQNYNNCIRVNKFHFFDNFQDRYRADWEFNPSEIENDSSTYYNPNYCELLYNHYNVGQHLYDKKIFSIAKLDSTLNIISIPSILKRIILSQYLEQIVSEAPWDVIQKNSGEYLNLYPSSELPDFLMQKYAINSTNINDVALVNAQGFTTTLNDVLSSLRGKEVILDIWASWCSPCINKIMTEKEERERNKKKGIEYVFITFMDNEAAWKKRIKELELLQEEHCYFTTNSQTVQWFIDMKITSVPHVIRYNKVGVITGQEK